MIKTSLDAVGTRVRKPCGADGGLDRRSGATFWRTDVTIPRERSPETDPSRADRSPAASTDPSAVRWNDLGPPASRAPRRLASLSAILVVAGFLSFSIDLPTARWLERPRTPDAREPRRGPVPGDVAKLLNLSEVFGYSPTAFVILLAALLLDPSLQSAGGARRFLRMIAATFSGGLSTDLIKAFVVRVRPYAADLGAHASAWDTFQNVEAASGAAIRSFPSGHAAVAAGLAATLSWRYPRGGPLFVVLALAAATQRLTSRSHYASDVCFGAAIALALAAAWMLRANAAVPERFGTPPPSRYT